LKGGSTLKKEGFGELELIIGTMFGGKSEYLKGKARRFAKYAEKKVMCFVSCTNEERDGEGQICTHDGGVLDAINVFKISEILELVEPDTYAVFIDEIHFFTDIKENIRVILELMRRGHNVYVGGLDSNFFGQPFFSTLALVPYASHVETLRAICTNKDNGGTCGRRAMLNQLVDSDGNPTFNAAEITVGSDRFKPRCPMCFVWPAQE